MNDKNYIGVGILVAVLVSVALFVASNRPASPAAQGSQNLGEITVLKSGELTGTSVKCNTTSTLLIGTSTSRQYLAIVNDGTTNIYLKLASRPAVLYEGIRLNSGGGTYEITQENLYTGPIYCIADTSAASTTLTYK